MKTLLVKVVLLTALVSLLPAGNVWPQQTAAFDKNPELSINSFLSRTNATKYRFLIYQPEAYTPEVVLAQEQPEQAQQGQQNQQQPSQPEQGQQVQPEQAPPVPGQEPLRTEGYGWGYYWWWWIIIAGIIIFFIIIFAAWGGWGGGRKGGGTPPDDRV